MNRRNALWMGVAVLLVAAALRLIAFGEAPPGLYHDEAYHGLDVLDVLTGHLSLYFPANNGREPLFIYLIGLAVGLLGKSPFALRLAAFPIGILTVAATMAMGRALFSRRVGLLASAVLAVTLWHVHLSRVGYRAVLLPLFIALTVWQGALGVKRARGTRRQGDKGIGRRGDKGIGRQGDKGTGRRGDKGIGRQGDKGIGRQGDKGIGRQGCKGLEAGERLKTPNLKSQISPPRVLAVANLPSWWCHWIAAGVFYGLSFYTYTAARFTPVALVTFGLYILLVWLPTSNLQPPTSNLQPPTSNLQLRRGAGLATLAALVVIAPLAAYTVDHPDVVLGRPDQVFIFNQAIHDGSPWTMLGVHALRTAGMFFVRGDRIWRHNVPWRPVFDPVLGGAFVLGLLVALCRIRRDPAAGFVLIWTAVMSLPTLLAEDAPHFLRAVGVLPVIALLPALGLDWLAGVSKPLISNLQSPTSNLQSVILVFPLLFGLSSTTWAYFGHYARDPVTGYWFERGAVALAGRINGFLGLGWDGERMVWENPRGSGKPLGFADRQVYLDPVLWEEWQPQVRFLVAAPEAVTVGLELERDQIPNPQSPISNPRVAVFIWPYGDWQRASLRVQALLPAPAEVTVEEGPLSQGDRDPQPFMTYLAFFATPPDPTIPALARFSEGVELLGVEVVPVDGGTPPLVGGDAGSMRVRLRWRATAPLAEDYTIFLHYLRDGERIAQADSRPAGGHYPTTVWRPGDVVNDDHYVEGIGLPLSGHDVLLIGLWQPESGVVLYLLDEGGNPAGDWIEVPVDG